MLHAGFSFPDSRFQILNRKTQHPTLYMNTNPSQKHVPSKQTIKPHMPVIHASQILRNYIYVDVGC